MSSFSGAKVPKPKFISADETSLKLKLDIDGLVPKGAVAKLQYKEPREDWDRAREVTAKTPTTEIVDLKPGTPYYVRIAFIGANGATEYGDDAVFDTRAIECGPRGGGGCVVA
jgi:hypothetical protein